MHPGMDPQVILNVTNIGSRLSGIGIYSLRLLREFMQMKTPVHFIVYLNETARLHFQGVHFPENFTVHWVSGLLSPDYGFRGHLLRLLYANFLSLRHPGVLIFNTSQLVVNFFRSRQIITIHDVIPLLFRRFHRKQFYYFKYLLRFALRPAGQIITPSRHSRELLNRIYGLPAEKIRLIPNGIDRAPAAANTTRPSEEPPYILYIGRLCPMKNIGRLLAAFQQIRARIPHRLILVGEGERYLRRELKRSGLCHLPANDERIVIRGHVRQEEKFALLKNAALFVFPSLYEGFGLPPLEAMAAGCPVVTSYSASLPEVCGEAAHYVDPYDVEDIAAGMERVLSDPHLREQLVQQGFRQAEQYDWKLSARHHLDIIEAQLHAEPATRAVRQLRKPEAVNV